jgi:hypothetical protein
MFLGTLTFGLRLQLANVAKPPKSFVNIPDLSYRLLRDLLRSESSF